MDWLSVAAGRGILLVAAAGGGAVYSSATADRRARPRRLFPRLPAQQLRGTGGVYRRGAELSMMLS